MRDWSGFNTTLLGEGDSVQEERFSCKTEIRDNEPIQTTLLKIIKWESER